MSTSPSSWSTSERSQALSVAAAPTAVVVASTLALSVLWPADLMDWVSLAVLALPFAYATLFFCVLPALMVLRRCGRETGVSFTLTVCVASVAPWALLYVVSWQIFAGSESLYAGVAAGLAVAGAVSATLAAAIWRAFGRASA